MVIANSGPLMAMAKLGKMELLQDLYGQVCIPKMVHTEVVVRGIQRGYADALLVRSGICRGQLAVIELRGNEIDSDIEALPLDAGEKQVLSLAIREKAALVLLDDMKARAEARIRGLKAKGTLGVIVEAYREGLLKIQEVQTLVDIIIARNDIWIAEGLCRRVLTRLRSENNKA